MVWLLSDWNQLSPIEGVTNVHKFTIHNDEYVICHNDNVSDVNGMYHNGYCGKLYNVEFSLNENIYRCRVYLKLAACSTPWEHPHRQSRDELTGTSSLGQLRDVRVLWMRATVSSRSTLLVVSNIRRTYGTMRRATTKRYSSILTRDQKIMYNGCSRDARPGIYELYMYYCSCPNEHSYQYMTVRHVTVISDLSIILEIVEFAHGPEVRQCYIIPYLIRHTVGLTLSSWYP